MSNWITKATGAFKGDDSSPQAFELFCECGQKHTGLRRAKWQRIVCRNCGGSLFVMQRDPYPPPKERPAPVPSRSDVEDQTGGDPSGSRVDPPDEEYSVPARDRAKSSRARPLAPLADPKSRRAAPVVSAPSIAKLESSTGFWKPFRIILVVVTVLGVVTGFVMFRNSQRSAAERSLAGSIDKIKDAYQQGQWLEARNQLEQAVQAVDLLGREDAEAIRYRQQLAETTAMTSLLSQPLSSMLTEAAEAREKGPEDLQGFQFRVQGQWMLLEGQAEPMPSAKKSARRIYSIPIPLTLGEKNLPVVVNVVSADLSRLMAKSESESVVLAVQIASIELSEDESAWLIQTTPDSAVLWTDLRTYRGVGYPEEDAATVTELLVRQAKSLGVADESPE